MTTIDLVDGIRRAAEITERLRDVDSKALLAADAVKRSRYYASRSRKLLNLLLEDPSLGRTIGEAIVNEAVLANRWARRAVDLSIDAHEARIAFERENAAKGDPKP